MGFVNNYWGISSLNLPEGEIWGKLRGFVSYWVKLRHYRAGPQTECVHRDMNVERCGVPIASKYAYSQCRVS